MTAHASSTFATHWILPAWWIRAYETAVMSETDGDSAMAQALKAGLAPALSPFEMNALAVVLACLQEQLLTSGARRLSVASEEHLKHAGTASRPKRLLFEKVIQNLCGIRVLAAEGGGDPRAHRLFAHDVWRVSEGQGDGVTCELTPSRLGFELVLGYADAHLDLIRFAQGEPTAGAVLGAAAPLALTRSLWLDLAGVDQLLLLRLERAMQWQFRWLQLEGVFGMPLAELFRGLKLEKSDDGGEGGELGGRLRSLARLGRKLSSHGFLASPQADCYLAVAEAEEKELSLVWQLTRERLGSEAAVAFRRSVATATRDHRYADFREPLHRIFLGPSPGEDSIARARALWERLGKIEEAPVDIGGLEHAPSLMISPQALFFELQLRQSSYSSRYPLPESVLAGPLGRLLRGAGAEGDEAERYREFCALLDDSPDLLRAFRDVPLATLTSEVSRKDATLVKHLGALLAPDAGARSLISRAGAETLAAHEHAADDKREALPATDVAAGARRKAQVSGALASRMLRIASDELTRLRESHPDRYADLKRSYLGSLDDVGRRLILDVQKRMQPTVFEEHLRQRLVRFMVDNPGAWRSAETPRREAGERPW